MSGFEKYVQLFLSCLFCYGIENRFLKVKTGSDQSLEEDLDLLGKMLHFPQNIFIVFWKACDH